LTIIVRKVYQWVRGRRANMGPEESWRIVEGQRYAIANIVEALDPAR